MNLILLGPPGAGKTYQGAHTIHALLRAGKRVGILSNSHRAIENLMRNSVIYASPGTDVEVEVGRRDDKKGPYAFVSIRDHGPGIPEDQLYAVGGGEGWDCRDDS